MSMNIFALLMLMTGKGIPPCVPRILRITNPHCVSMCGFWRLLVALGPPRKYNQLWSCHSFAETSHFWDGWITEIGATWCNRSCHTPFLKTLLEWCLISCKGNSMQGTARNHWMGARHKTCMITCIMERMFRLIKWANTWQSFSMNLTIIYYTDSGHLKW